MPLSEWHDLSDLVQALVAGLEAKRTGSPLGDAHNAVNAILLRGSVEATETHLTEIGQAAVFHCVIQPYATKVFQTNSLTCGPLARLLHWYMLCIDDAKRQSVWDVLLHAKEFDPSNLTVDKVTKGKHKAKSKKKGAAKANIGIFVNLISVKHCSGQEMDAIIALVQMAIDEIDDLVDDTGASDDEEGDLRAQSVSSLLASKPLLELYLNPLAVKETSNRSPFLLDCREPTGPTEVAWTDGRSDHVIGGSIQQRLRPDELLLSTLKSAASTNAGVSTLFSNLADMCKADSPFAKSQVRKILDTVLAVQDDDLFAVLTKKIGRAHV